MGKLTFGIGHLIKESDPEHGQACGTDVTPERVISVFDADATSHVAEVYRVVQLNFTHEIGVLSMLFDRCHTKILRDVSNGI